jgi:hypothetical protein
MALIDNMMDACVILNKAKVSDGEGGFTTEWSEGAEIRAAIVRDSTMTARIAEKDGVTSVYTITTRKDEMELEFHDVLKRLKDGLILRVTSDHNDAPDVSTLNMCQVNAEKWELTK